MNSDFSSLGPTLALKQVYVWSDVIITVKKLWDGCNLGSTICGLGVTFGVRAPKLLSAPKPIPIPKSVTRLFPMCLSLGFVMPAFESALVEATKPTSISLCSQVPCKDKVAAVVAAAAGSFPSGSQVLGLCMIAIVTLSQHVSGPSDNSEETS